MSGTLSQNKALIIGFIVFTADLLSKFLTHSYLPIVNYHLWYPYGGIAVFENLGGIQFSINHAINKGAAWGVLAEWQDYILYLRIAVISGLLSYALIFNRRQSWEIPLLLIISGAIGNVLDYFLYGHVIDMLHFVLWGYDYPIFNIADSAIFIGIFWIFILSFVDKASDAAKRAVK